MNQLLDFLPIESIQFVPKKKHNKDRGTLEGGMFC